jgi:hypothetical protein
MKRNKVFRKDLSQTNLLVKVGKESGRNAVRRSKAMDLVVTYIENGKVIEEQPDGSKNQIETIEIQPLPIRIKKGMILHGKQKEGKDFCWA